MRWRDVSSITHGAILGCYWVKCEGVRPVMVSQLLVGQRDFAEAVLGNVRSSAVEREHQLRQVLNGRATT